MKRSLGTPTIFVDSVNGRDSYDGLTITTPKQSLAAAQALCITGSVIWLRRGSYWREQFNITANDITIFVYGQGAVPIIDGADAAGTWTQPDSVTYPNVWSQEWTRTSATTTSSEYLGYWEDGVRPTRYATATLITDPNAYLDLQTNGGWFSSDLTAQTSTVSIKNVTNPNTDGVLREITKRHYGINGHNDTLGVTRTGQKIIGPIEIKRCVGHYNAYPGGTGLGASKLFLRDGNIHHAVTEGQTTEDSLATEYSPATAPSAFVSYSAVGTSFDHTFRRCLVLFPGGGSRIANGNASGFYGHSSSTPPNMRNQTLEGCVVRGASFGGPSAANFSLVGGFCEDPYGIFIGATATTSNRISHFLGRDTAAPSPTPTTHVGMRAITATSPLQLTQSAFYTIGNSAVAQFAGTAGTISATNSSFVASSSTPITGVSGDRTTPTINKCVMWGARCYDEFATGYVGDYNVFYFIGQTNAQFSFNGTTYNSLTTFQSASGQDTNSVFLKSTDQTISNTNAFWLGVSTGINSGPVDGDFRINPSAKVYKGDGTSLIGLFADGVTAITAVGPQEHYDFNLRTVVANPSSRYPTLPTTIVEMRSLVNSPTSWNYYP